MKSRSATARVTGVIDEEEATIDVPIDRDQVNRQRMATTRQGREAITHFNVSERYKDATLLDVEIETGRTHQIRVHLQAIGHGVIGDTQYGEGEAYGLKRQFLHAARLEAYHAAMEKVRAQLPHLRLLSSGPWPPYSFVAE